MGRHTGGNSKKQKNCLTHPVFIENNKKFFLRISHIFLLYYLQTDLIKRSEETTEAII